MHITPFRGYTVDETNAFIKNISSSLNSIEQDGIEKQKEQDQAQQAENNRNT